MDLTRQVPEVDPAGIGGAWVLEVENIQADPPEGGSGSFCSGAAIKDQKYPVP